MLSGVSWAGSVQDVPPAWDALFAAAPAQSSRAWWAATERTALSQGIGARYLLCTQGGAPAALVPLASGPARWSSLTTLYTTIYQPLLTADADAALVGQAMAASVRGAMVPVAMVPGVMVPGVVVLDALDADWPPLTEFLAGARQGGLRARRFRHFGNWYQNVSAMDYAAYIASRGGRLRETIRRRSAAALRDPAVRLELVQEPAAIPAALAAYEAVYARSWKTPEPFADFNAALLPGLAAEGCLRMGLLWVGDRPAAAQYWTVRHGVATVLKLAHDEADHARSFGTVLTAWMIRHLFKHDQLTVLDFGRGDDPYKREWVDCRRERIGVLLARPGTLRGAAALLRHDAGSLRRLLRGVLPG